MPTSTKNNNFSLPLQISVWIKIALFNFLVAASIGLLLRYAFVNEVKWLSYKSFQNAHSNIALLGWAYQAIFAFLIGAYISRTGAQLNKYRILFWINQVCVITLAICLITTGNNLLSNLVLSMFSFFSLYFIWSFLRDTRGTNENSLVFIRWAMVFLGLSFIGVYLMIPALLVSGSKKILLYYLSSHFFLHFQYNGWFIFAIIGLFLKMCEGNLIRYDIKITNRIALWLGISVFLTFFVSLYWGNQSKLWLLAIAALGGIIQASILIYYRQPVFKLCKEAWKSLDRRFRVLFLIAGICFILKLVMQLMLMSPFIATLAFTIRNYVIAYLHLVFIGFASMFLFGWALEHRFITIGKAIRLGVSSLIVGFVLVEFILFIQGTMLWMGRGFISNYYIILFAVTLLLPLGLFIIAFKNLKYLPFKY